MFDILELFHKNPLKTIPAIYHNVNRSIFMTLENIYDGTIFANK